MEINLISDTFTKPTAAMLDYMFSAPVGDDVFGEDPSVNALESYVTELFGYEAAVFCPSGTMTNQLAIKCHTVALDEVICDHFSHVFLYESAGYAFHSGVSIQPIKGEYGKIAPQQIQEVIKPSYDWLSKSALVVLENSTNKGGGNYYTLAEQQAIRQCCAQAGLKLHLDGARLFNVLVETNESPKEIAQCYDSISLCLSKGLGAPVGSVLMGSASFIKQARRFRKVMGGGMRQAGFLAAAGMFALQNHIPLLKKDNDKARYIGEVLANLPYVSSVNPVKTNIVIFDLREKAAVEPFLSYLSQHHIRANAFGGASIRFVFHLDVNDAMIEALERILRNYETK